jgi:hypothetical protein
MIPFKISICKNDSTILQYSLNFEINFEPKHYLTMMHRYKIQLLANTCMK